MCMRRIFMCIRGYRRRAVPLVQYSTVYYRTVRGRVESSRFLSIFFTARGAGAHERRRAIARQAHRAQPKIRKTPLLLV
jgi:hypothetical protein